MPKNSSSRPKSSNGNGSTNRQNHGHRHDQKHHKNNLDENTVTITPKQQLQSKLDKAAELENKLNTSVTNASTQTSSHATSSTNEEAKASQLRVQLCEIFSDILLTDPTIASRKDVCGRMWRCCFYGRIGELRSRIMKEKARLKKILKKQQKQQSRPLDGQENAIAQQGKAIKTLEERLKVFIQEAVVLYEYLVDQLQGMLAVGTEDDSDFSPNPNSQRKHDNAIESQNSGSTFTSGNNNSTKSSKSNGTIPILHKLFIYLGDLHRYANSYPAAESAYGKAACLAPGKGNPYNQLAVVAQLNDASSHPLPAVALYWYCRSLLAVNDVFETSRSNLQRLFDANRQWMKDNDMNENSQDGALDINGAGTSRGKHRELKAAASRKFLSRFVDFEGKLFSDFLSKDSSTKTPVDLESIEKEMHSLILRFNTLLIESAFGDALLMKIVSIHAFSIWNGLSRSPADASCNVSTLIIVSLSFAMEFGAHLARNMEGFLERANSKQQQQGGKQSTSIRLIGPLLLICNFLSFMFKRSKEMEMIIDFVSNENQAGTPLRKLFTKSQREYWSAIATLTNVMRKSTIVSKMLEKGGKDNNDDLALPDDFKSTTRGYAPFAFFDSIELEMESSQRKSHEEMKNRQRSVKAYVGCEDVIELLELHPAQSQSQRSSQHSKKSSSQITTRDPKKVEEDTRLKLKHLMKFISRHIASGDIVETNEDGLQIVVVGDIHRVSFKPSELNSTSLEMDEDNQTDQNENEDVETDLMEIDNDDSDNEDVVVYKTTDSGQALLVPSALLLNSNEKKESKKEISKQDSSNDEEVPMDISENNIGGDTLSKSMFNLTSLLSHPKAESSRIESILNNAQTEPHNLSDTMNNNQNPIESVQPVLPPMPQTVKTNHQAEVDGGANIRPPPGFNSNLHPEKIPLQGTEPVEPSIREAFPGNENLNFPNQIGFSSFSNSANEVGPTDPHMSVLPPFPMNYKMNGGHVSQTPNMPPQSQPVFSARTQNPFAYPMPPLGNSIDGLDRNNSSQAPRANQQNPDIFDSYQQNNLNAPSNDFLTAFTENAEHSLLTDSLNTSETDQQYDLFGLRSLGLFDNDDSNLNAKSTPQTRNPFIHD